MEQSTLLECPPEPTERPQSHARRVKHPTHHDFGPLERERSAHRACRRVAYHLVRLATLKVPPGSISHAPSFVLQLAREHRLNGYGYLYWVLCWYAVNLEHGYTMRELLQLGPDDLTRAIHKRGVRSRQ